MIFFYSSSANSPWYVPFLFVGASLFLQGGWLPPFGPLSYLLGFPFSFGRWPIQSGASSARAIPQQDGSSVVHLVCLTIAVAASFIICKFFIALWRESARIGLKEVVRKLWATPIRQWSAALNATEAARQATPGEQPRPAEVAQSHQARFEQVSKRVQQLPTEIFMSREELEQLSLHDLKAKLLAIGLKFKPGESIDRQEAITMALEKGGSSSISCGICCEDYLSQDVLRKLPKCGHRFHLECIDRWLFSSTDYSKRPSSCPICITEL